MRSLLARTVTGGCGAYLLLTACGAWGRSPTAPETPPPLTGPTVTITSGGLTPPSVHVPRGGRLTIVNEDAIPHDMGSDPHPGRDDCPELNRIGMLHPGQQRTSAPLLDARTCGMHDHLRPLVTSLHLRVTIR
jgi:hypothetical protein